MGVGYIRTPARPTCNRTLLSRNDYTGDTICLCDDDDGDDDDDAASAGDDAGDYAKQWLWRSFSSLRCIHLS